jgi:hypothetical protein
MVVLPPNPAIMLTSEEPIQAECLEQRVCNRFEYNDYEICLHGVQKSVSHSFQALVQAVCTGNPTRFHQELVDAHTRYLSTLDENASQ